MSSVYVLEPPTRGKVVLNTTEGPLDIELWPKEAPKAVRNFVQLCMDGYYDNTIFHRIIKSFMMQGGDRSGSGTGGESIYGAPFADEFHSRLRFNHRGLVACANPGTPNTNNSQFFITLDRCDWLDRKNTIFGKVTGDTVYNLMKLGDVETGPDDKPIEPIPMILSTEVLWCPFDDIVPRQDLPSVEPIAEDRDTKSKSKKVKKLNLLSFGDEAQQEEEELATINVKIKSSHDVLDDPRLLKGDIDNSEVAADEEKRKELQASVKEALSTKKKGDSGGVGGSNSSKKEETSDDEDVDFDAAMRRRVLNKIKKFDEGRISKRPAEGKNSTPDVEQTSFRDDDEDASTKHEKLSLKKKGLGSEARTGLLLKVDVDAQLLGPLEQQRHVHKQRKRARQGREEATLEKLKQFQTNLLKAKMESSNNETGKEEKEEDSGWLVHRLEFSTDKQKDKMARNDDPDQYVVHDPLLEKGKEKFNKLQAKMKRREREWAGKSIA